MPLALEIGHMLPKAGGSVLQCLEVVNGAACLEVPQNLFRDTHHRSPVERISDTSKSEAQYRNAMQKVNGVSFHQNGISSLGSVCCVVCALATASATGSLTTAARIRKPPVRLPA